MDTSHVKALISQDEAEDKRRFFEAQEGNKAESTDVGGAVNDVLGGSNFSVTSLLDSLKRSDEERRKKMQERRRLEEEELAKKGIQVRPAGAVAQTTRPPREVEVVSDVALDGGAPESMEVPSATETVTAPPTPNNPPVAANVIPVRRSDPQPSLADTKLHEMLTNRSAEIERLTEQLADTQSQLNAAKLRLAPDDKLLEAYHKDNERLTNENKRLMSRVRSLEEEVVRAYAKGQSSPSQPENAGVAERLKAELNTREAEHKVEIEKLSKEKKELERRLSNVDWGKVEDDAIQLRALKAELAQEKSQHDTELQEVKSKLQWYIENMNLAQHSAELLREQQNTITQLRARVGELEGSESKSLSKTKSVMERDRAHRDLSRRVQELEEALKMRYPNSIPELIRACRPTDQELEEQRAASQKIRDLESRLVAQGEEADAVIKNLRLECDRMRVKYETQAKQKDDDMRTKMQAMHSKREKELEKASSEMRQYYLKKIKELEGTITAMRRNGSVPASIKKPVKSHSDATPSKAIADAFSPTPQKAVVSRSQGDAVPTSAKPSIGGAPPKVETVLAEEFARHSDAHAREVERLQATIAQIRGEKERFKAQSTEANHALSRAQHDVTALEHRLQETERNLHHATAVAEQRLDLLRKEHQETMWRLRQEHATEVAQMRTKWESDVSGLKQQVDQAMSIPQLASLDARGRVEYLQMVSQRLQMVEQQFAFRVSELKREAAEARNVARMEISVEKQKMQLTLEQKNAEVERFRIQVTTLLHDLAVLRGSLKG
eukprot:PhM_4_TR13220/c0_g1_i1/m.56574